MTRAIGQFLGVLLIIAASAASAAADISLPAIFSDGMVLQQGREQEKTTPIWGRAEDGERVTVSFQGQRVSTVARRGRWLVRLQNLRAGGPWSLEVRGRNRIVIEKVLVGEVWLCSGQSNMAAVVSESRDAAREVAGSENPMLRLFRVPRLEADAASWNQQHLGSDRLRSVSRVMRESPDGRLTGEWEESRPETVGRFSAVCYFFGRELQRARRVPVGLIDASVGATPIEAWMDEGSLRADPELKQAFDSYQQAMAEFKRRRQEGVEQRRRDASSQDPDQARQPWRPGGLYNGMIVSLQPFAVSGIIWWQGEANVRRAGSYRSSFSKLIGGWRAAWGRGAFPFLFVQLATAGPANGSAETGEVWGRPALAWAELREAQLQTLSLVPKTAMVVITDIGGENYHPDWKQPIGARLSLAARRVAYGEQLVHSGPIFSEMKIEGERVRLSFQHVGSGLTARGAELHSFKIAGEDRVFHRAKAEIKLNQVILTAPSVKRPVAARYNWSAHPTGNLFNREGLPASPFRTDRWPGVSQSVF